MATPGPNRNSTLRRQLGVTDAVVVGLGSMVGAGVFAVWGPAADVAGGALLLGLVVAGMVAFCNATSSAQLAALHPESGGTYVYARERLGPAWGHLAGWGFVVGKTASCAAMALAVGSYVWPSQARFVAAVAVVGILGVNLLGLSRTVLVTKALLVVSVGTLALVIALGWTGGQADLGRIDLSGATVWNVLGSAGLLFFAFAGYARIATLGEEVHDPARTIPRAVPIALGLVLAVYVVVGVTLLASVPTEEIAASDAPLRLVAERSGAPWLAGMVRFGAGVAALGVLLNLIPGVSRTMLAMARRRELPTRLARISTRRSSPVVAECFVALVVVLLVVVLELRRAIAVSSVGVLSYYALTNASALRLTSVERRWPRMLAWVGLAGCVVMVAALPVEALIGGAIVIVVGVVARAIGIRVAGQPA